MLDRTEKFKKSVLKRLAKNYPKVAALSFSSKHSISSKDLSNFTRKSVLQSGLPKLPSYVSPVVPRTDETRHVVIKPEIQR